MDSPQRVVLDMDSTEIPVYGQQEQGAYNGHFQPAITRCCCLTGKETVWRASCDLVTCAVLKTGMRCFCQRFERQQEVRKEVVFRADAAFA